MARVCPAVVVDIIVFFDVLHDQDSGANSD
jgi:hypothetical protein